MLGNSILYNRNYGNDKVYMKILSMYITMMPLVLGGISNMIFTKTKLYKKYKYPIDGYTRLSDGNRLFGDNKTIIGFASMIVFVTVINIIWGFVCMYTNLEGINNWYDNINNSICNNALIGSLIGFIYMLLELPNSFIKRRLGISPGITESGIKGKIFFIIDQIDSLIGVFLLLIAVSNLGFKEYIEYVILGAVSHLMINIILHKIKLRNNI